MDQTDGTQETWTEFSWEPREQMSTLRVFFPNHHLPCIDWQNLTDSTSMVFNLSHYRALVRQ